VLAQLVPRHSQPTSYHKKGRSWAVTHQKGPNICTYGGFVSGWSTVRGSLPIPIVKYFLWSQILYGYSLDNLLRSLLTLLNLTLLLLLTGCPLHADENESAIAFFCVVVVVVRSGSK
jgi:hypothetical protein